MQENEVKILGINKEEVIKKLEELGAIKKFDGQVAASIFDTPDNRLYNKKDLLRLRKVGDKIELVYKEGVKHSEVMSCNEHEIIVDDFDSAVRILRSLGFDQTGETYSKERISYVFNDIHFEIDTHPGIPAFLEVEGKTKEDVEVGVKLLGYEMKDTKAWNGEQVKKYYEEKSNS